MFFRCDTITIQVSYIILYHSILSYPILSYPTLPYPTLPYPTLSYPILSYPPRVQADLLMARLEDLLARLNVSVQTD